MTDEPTPLEKFTEFMEHKGPKWAESAESMMEESRRRRKIMARLERQHIRETGGWGPDFYHTVYPDLVDKDRIITLTEDGRFV